MAILSSKWQGLSVHLQAKFYAVKPVKENDVRRYVPMGGDEVWAPISDDNFEQSVSWSSPFENQTPGAASPVLDGMLQTGLAGDVLNALAKRAGLTGNATVTALSNGLDSLRGSTTVSKLNSTQVYTGSPPLKLTLTAHFRAYSEPVEEVEKPVHQLLAWAAPQFLAEDGAIPRVVAEKTGDGPVRDIYASRAPQIICMQYGRVSYSPMVIESISRQLSVQRDRHGRMIRCALQMTLASLTALDANDYKKMMITA